MGDAKRSIEQDLLEAIEVVQTARDRPNLLHLGAQTAAQLGIKPGWYRWDKKLRKYDHREEP